MCVSPIYRENTLWALSDRFISHRLIFEGKYLQFTSLAILQENANFASLVQNLAKKGSKPAFFGVKTPIFGVLQVILRSGFL
jgi:hypothetical protein